MTPKNDATRMLTRDPLFREMFLFSLPVMAMTCFQLLFNTTDMIVVGLFSAAKRWRQSGPRAPSSTSSCSSLQGSRRVPAWWSRGITARAT